MAYIIILHDVYIAYKQGLHALAARELEPGSRMLCKLYKVMELRYWRQESITIYNYYTCMMDAIFGVPDKRQPTPR